MRKTRPSVLAPSAEQQGGVQPPLELPYPEEAGYIGLPKPDELQIPNMTLRQAIAQRRSLRDYSGQPLSLDELAYLLWAAQGVKRVTSRPATLRTVPSAGARHAFETYLLVNRVEELAPGLYRYLALEHALIAVDLSAEIKEKITRACRGQSHVRDSAVTVIWMAVAERMLYRYGERGYRYLHLDAGHACQNLYLAAENIGCGACAIAAFDDDLFDATLKLDGDEQFVIYAASLGKKPV